MVHSWGRGLALGFALAAAAHAGDEGVTSTEIRLGASQVLSGPLGPQTVQYGEGARLLFDMAKNRHRGGKRQHNQDDYQQKESRQQGFRQADQDLTPSGTNT